MKNNGEGQKVESESIVGPDPNVRPMDPMDLPLEVRVKMFADEYNELVRKWGVGLGIVHKSVSPQYHVTELQPIPIEQLRQ